MLFILLSSWFAEAELDRGQLMDGFTSSEMEFWGVKTLIECEMCTSPLLEYPSIAVARIPVPGRFHTSARNNDKMQAEPKGEPVPSRSVKAGKQDSCCDQAPNVQVERYAQGGS